MYSFDRMVLFKVNFEVNTILILQYQGMKTTNCVKESLLYEQEGNKVQCKTCERFCEIAAGKLGFCKTRMNIGGETLYFRIWRYFLYKCKSNRKETVFPFLPGQQSINGWELWL